MTTTDVNTQFDENRASQIASLQDARQRYQDAVRDFESGDAQKKLNAELERRVASGEIQMVGSDRYRSMQGWDRGEVFRVQRATRPGELTLIEPESGLDFRNGVAQGLFSQPEWHGLGNVVQGVTSISEALTLSGLDYDVLQAPAKFWANGELRDMPGSFVNYRSDTGAGLGSVGKIYEPFQNVQAFAFIQEMIQRYDVSIASAAPLAGGRRVFVTVELPEDLVLELPGGVTDTVKQYLAVLNSHDGSGKIKAIVTPWRIRCRNTERLAVDGAVMSWGTRHTKNADQRAAEAARSLGLTQAYFARFKAEEESLARTEVTINEVDELISTLWPEPDEVREGQRELTTREKNTIERRESALRGIFAEESARVGRSAFAAERAVTDYLDHVKNRNGGDDGLAAARASAIIEGDDDQTKSRAHKLLMTLAA